MKQCFCYDTEELLRLLPGFQMKAIPVKHENEDDSYESTDYHITNKDNIESIERIDYYYSLGVTVTVEYSNGAYDRLYGNNISVPGQEPLRMTRNKFLSPRLRTNGDYIEATPDLLEWLKFNGVSEVSLSQIVSMVTVYSVIEYPGVPTPSKQYGSWGYSSEDLRLDEREIEAALNDIEDELLRKKIECILYARVFKRQYH